ncbi:MAG: hypothetical protein K9G62_05865 [Alphaproteobacteria bacterium]|nr:hypothetical protein [Alphaproteobacteria bacterium]
MKKPFKEPSAEEMAKFSPAQVALYEDLRTGSLTDQFDKIKKMGEENFMACVQIESAYNKANGLVSIFDMMISPKNASSAPFQPHHAWFTNDLSREYPCHEEPEMDEVEKERLMEVEKNMRRIFFG